MATAGGDRSGRSLGGPLGGGAQGLVLDFQLDDAGLNRSHEGGDLGAREAWGDVLGAVPVEGAQLQHEGAFRNRLAPEQGEGLGQRRRVRQVAHRQSRQDLQPGAVRLVHQD